MFDNLSDRLQAVFQKLGSKGRLTEEDVREGMKQVRMALLEADVNFKVAREFVARTTEKAIGEEVMKSLTPSQQVVKIVYDELVSLLGEANVPLAEARPGPTVVLLMGLQGSGKTTLAAKLALQFRKKGRRPLLVAGDIYRPAAIAQLESLGKQLGIAVHSEGTGTPPPLIAQHAIERARQESFNVVIVDTAGRLQIDEALMQELADINAAANPTERLLVVDAMIGQEAVRVADEFNKRVGVTGLVMTKIDGDARGGAALSVRSVTGVPIKLLSTGEKVDGDTLEAFHPERMASRILGMGDVLSLIERAQQAVDVEEAQAMEKKLRKGKFDFEDFLVAMRQMRRIGPLQQIMAMIPGLGKLTPEQEMLSEKELKKVEAIIFSMTPQERRNPDIIKGRRRERIARGSGTQVQDVSQLIKQFMQMQRMMKKFTGGGKGGRPMDPNDLFRMLR